MPDAHADAGTVVCKKFVNDPASAVEDAVQGTVLTGDVWYLEQSVFVVSGRLGMCQQPPVE